MTASLPSAEGALPRPGRLLPAAAALAFLALGAGAILAARGRAPSRPEPPRLFAVPDFALVERSGRPLRRDDLRGRPWVADFIFTRCGGICPAMTARMARLRRELGPEVGLVSFTVDPAHDTPEALARYAERFGADKGWLFVTGTKEALYDLSMNGFKLAAEELPPGQSAPGGDGPFLHSGKFVLVDGEAAIRGYYDSADEDSMRDLAADVAAVRAGR